MNLSEYVTDKWKIASLLPTEEDEDPLRRERARRVALCTRLARRSHLGGDSPLVTEVYSELEEETGLDDSQLNKVFATSAKEAASTAHFFGAPRVAEMLAKLSASLSGQSEAEVLAEIEAREAELNEAQEEKQQEASELAERSEGDDSQKEPTSEESEEKPEGEPEKESDDDGNWAGVDEEQVVEDEDPSQAVTEYESTIQLDTLREISSLMLAQADASIVLGKILYGMRNGIGLDRVLFAIVNRESNVLVGKIALGAAGPSWHERCRFVIEEGSFLWRIGQSLTPRWVKGDELKEVPHHMQVVFGRGEFLIAPVISNGNWIAAFYGDRRSSQRELSDEICAAFGQFALQGAFALSAPGKK